MTAPRSGFAPFVAAALLAPGLCAPRAAAQPSAPPEASLVSLGGQVGSLGGLTLRMPARTPQSWIVTLGFDGDDRAVLGAGRQVETRLPASPLRLFAAPGLFVGTGEGAVSAGVNTAVGFGFYRARFDVFLTAVPTLALVGRAGLRVDAGAGVRYAL